MNIMGSIWNLEFRIQDSGSPSRSQEPGARSGEFSVRRSAFSDGGASAKERSGFQRSRSSIVLVIVFRSAMEECIGVLAFVFRVLVVVFVFPKLRLSRGFPPHSRLRRHPP
jgi:hypothetical protein